jgi:hypothetical protein
MTGACQSKYFYHSEVNIAVINFLMNSATPALSSSREWCENLFLFYKLLNYICRAHTNTLFETQTIINLIEEKKLRFMRESKGIKKYLHP